MTCTESANFLYFSSNFLENIDIDLFPAVVAEWFSIFLSRVFFQKVAQYFFKQCVPCRQVLVWYHPQSRVHRLRPGKRVCSSDRVCRLIKLFYMRQRKCRQPFLCNLFSQY